MVSGFWLWYGGSGCGRDYFGGGQTPHYARNITITYYTTTTTTRMQVSIRASRIRIGLLRDDDIASRCSIRVPTGVSRGSIRFT